MSNLISKIWTKVLYRANPNQLFPGSGEYWEKRYKEGGTSGGGSYNRLALFKAEVLNGFVAKNNIDSVIEFGCGDGNQLKLAAYPNYIGLDVSKKAIQMCTKVFAQDQTKSFFLYDPFAFTDNGKIFRVDLALSLDVIYHLVEDEVFETYMRHLFHSAEQYVIVYSSDFEGAQRFHERDRKFTEWVEKNILDWRLKEVIKNKFPEDRTHPEETSKADFFIYTRKNS
jgi:hypothetical protein